jgi:ABC-type transport system substrate-binding protein
MVLALSNYAPCPREAIDYWLTGQGKTPPDERSVEFTEAEMVVGTGAYILHTFRRKDQVVLVRNPDYREEYYPTAEEMIELAERRGFGEAGRDWVAQLESMGLLQDAAKRVPFIDAMVFEFVGETYPAWMLFLSRRTDASGIPRETFEGIVTPEKKLTDQWRRRGIYMRTSWVPSVYWIAFNMEDPLLGASQSLRQAMCLSYNVAMQIKVLYNDRGRPARNIVPTAFKAHRAAGPGPWYRFDVEAAKQKIAQARSELAAAGLLDEDGEIPEIKFDLGQGTNSKRMAEFARQQFSRIGLRIKPVHNDWPTLQQKVHNKQAQMYTMGWHADYYDSETFLQLFYSPNIAKGTNNTNYSNPAYDRLYEQIRSMPDTPRRTELYAEMINIISEDVPVLLLSEPQAFVLYYDWFQNVLRHPIGYGFSKYQRIDAEMRRKMGGRP